MVYMWVAPEKVSKWDLVDNGYIPDHSEFRETETPQSPSFNDVYHELPELPRIGLATVKYENDYNVYRPNEPDSEQETVLNRKPGSCLPPWETGERQNAINKCRVDDSHLIRSHLGAWRDLEEAYARAGPEELEPLDKYSEQGNLIQPILNSALGDKSAQL